MRIIVDSQSNPSWRGSFREQMFGLRGGLCEVGEGHLVVVERPYDPVYLDCWAEQGFTIPDFVVVPRGEDQLHLNLSELIEQNQDSQDEIRRRAIGHDCRLEFFWITEAEQRLADLLGLDAHHGFIFAKEFASKTQFHRLGNQLSIPLMPGHICDSFEDLVEFATPYLNRNEVVLVKAAIGTGGVNGGSLRKLASVADLDSFRQQPGL